jgi:hypothetical protein
MDFVSKCHNQNISNHKLQSVLDPYQFDNRSTPNGYSPVSPLVRMVDEMLMNLTELRTRHLDDGN